VFEAAKALGVTPRRAPYNQVGFRPGGQPYISNPLVASGGLGQRLIVDAEIAKRWLELQYGWLPLLKDIYGGAEFLAHHLNVPLQRRYRVSRIVNGRAETAAPVNAKFKRAWCQDLVQIIAIVSEKDVTQLAGLQDPASVAWELLPWSFVADWFIPIGSWLSSRGLAGALEGTFITTRTRKGYAADPVPTLHSYPYSFETPYEYREVTVSRRVTTELQVPLPSFRPLNKVLSWKRAANAVALIAVVASGQKVPPGVLTD
jgi:hypothetical protein